MNLMKFPNIILLLLFVCIAVSAVQAAWTVDITAQNQLEPVVFGYDPEATDNNYNPALDEITTTPIMGKVILSLDDLYAKKIKKDDLSWTLSVSVPSGSTDISWDTSTVPENIKLSMTKDTTVIDMKVQPSLTLQEGPHEYTITAEVKAQSVLTGIDVSPSKISLEEGKNKVFSAKGYDQYGNDMTGLTFTWSSSDTTAGTIDSSTGLFTALKVGNTTVSATSGGKTGTAQVTVEALPQSGVILSLPELDLKTFESGTIPMTVGNITGGEGICATVTWDSSVINIESFEVNESVFSGLSITCNLTQNSAKFVVIDDYLFDASSPQPFVDIVYKALGNKNDYTELSVCDASWSSSYNNYTCCCTDGSVSIIGMLADFNENNEIDIGDVSKVAYMVVDKVTDNMEADFNKDGDVDTGDAAKISWYLIGKIPML